MKKRIFIFLLVGAMAFSFVACGEKNPNGNSVSSQITQAETSDISGANLEEQQEDNSLSSEISEAESNVQINSQPATSSKEQVSSKEQINSTSSSKPTNSDMQAASSKPTGSNSQAISSKPVNSSRPTGSSKPTSSNAQVTSVQSTTTSSNVQTSSQNKPSIDTTSDKTSSQTIRPTTPSKPTKPNSNSTSSQGKNVNNSRYKLNYTINNPIYKNEFFVRDGLYNTLYKLHSGEDVTLGFVGGSITRMDGWRRFITEYFMTNYDGEVEEYNIAIGGTGADLGVCRVDELLKKDPDLVFIEYACNGGSAQHVEGLVLKIWEHDPTTDICFIYTASSSHYQAYSSGKLPPFVDMSEKVANHYNIPSVFFGKQAFEMIDAGELTISGNLSNAYTSDGTHPTERGHLLGAGAIARCIVDMERGFNKDAYMVMPHQIPYNTYHENPWTDAKIIHEYSKVKFEGSWTGHKLDTIYGRYDGYEHNDIVSSVMCEAIKEMRISKTPGSSVTIKFKGSALGIVEVGGPETGRFKVIVDGKEAENLEIFNKSLDDHIRMEYYFVKNLSDGEHTVTLIHDSELPDKSNLKNKNSQNAAEYDKNEVCIGAILVNGTLLDANK